MRTFSRERINGLLIEMTDLQVVAMIVQFITIMINLFLIGWKLDGIAKKLKGRDK